MKTTFTFALLLASFIGQAQLTVSLSQPGKNVQDIQFTSAVTGYACASTGNTFYKTTDGGSTWVESTVLQSQPSTIFFLNDNLGYVTGQNFSTSSQPGIIKTTDGGNNWTSYSLPVTNNERLDALYFTDDNTGYAAGQGGKIYRTTDGAANWAVVHTAATEFRDIFFLSPSLGFAVGSNGTILKTTDGITWEAKPSGVTTFLNAVLFVSQTVGYVASSQGIILKTIDGGETWSIAYTTTPSKSLTDIDVVGDKIFVSGAAPDFNAAGNIILSSTDGENWVPNILSGPQGINALDMLTENTGFAVGFNGIYSYIKPLASINSPSLPQIAVYPNPADSVVWVSLPDNSTEINYALFDVTGRAVNSGIFTGNSNTIAVSQLPSGVYFLRLQDTDTIVRIIKK